MGRMMYLKPILLYTLARVSCADEGVKHDTRIVDIERKQEGQVSHSGSDSDSSNSNSSETESEETISDDGSDHDNDTGKDKGQKTDNNDENHLEA